MPSSFFAAEAPHCPHRDTSDEVSGGVMMCPSRTAFADRERTSRHQQVWCHRLERRTRFFSSCSPSHQRRVRDCSCCITSMRPRQTTAPLCSPAFAASLTPAGRAGWTECSPLRGSRATCRGTASSRATSTHATGSPSAPRRCSSCGRRKGTGTPGAPCRGQLPVRAHKTRHQWLRQRPTTAGRGEKRREDASRRAGALCRERRRERLVIDEHRIVGERLLDHPTGHLRKSDETAHTHPLTRSATPAQEGAKRPISAPYNE